MKVLLVEPPRSRTYYTKYPPLGLLKIGAHHKRLGHEVRLVRGQLEDGWKPDAVYITSLFTYAYGAVHQMIDYYAATCKRTRIVVGGIYATLCADQLERKYGKRINVQRGVMGEHIDRILPDYSLVPDWTTSIVFSSRGCIRRCPYCSVKMLEPVFAAYPSIKNQIWPEHKSIVLWDNNFLASPHWEKVCSELEALGKEVDFNQGLDARLVTQDVARRLMRLRLKMVRFAYDSLQVREPLRRAIEVFKGLGLRGREISVYCLYNFQDTPEDFRQRVSDLLTWGVVAYPMRFEPLEARPKSTHVDRGWTEAELEMVADARRVVGYGGAFPPAVGLVEKIGASKTFGDAFSLR
ncbi:MAG: cobalamin B12-binding domain-containing protein [Candidatus Coatesbacteria bacterium]